MWDSRPLRRRFDQYSVVGIPPIGPIAPTANKTQNKMNPDINNENNNNVKITLNKFNTLPPISNIPGLNPDSEVIAAAEKKVFRKFKIHEADSSYVKLAKQGGRKNLLEYKEFEKENLSSKKIVTIPRNEKVIRPEWLEYEKEGTIEQPDYNPDDVDVNNNCDPKPFSRNANNCNSGGAAGARKSIIEMKKQAKMMKDRPDLLPVDNTEILKHLNAPKRPVLPKISHKSRFTSKFVKVVGR